jgi:PAS domain S-box-containing protein
MCPVHNLTDVPGRSHLETYAFDALGRLVGESRFPEQLRDIGLIGPDLHTDLKIELRDPGVNLVAGERAAVPRDQQPLTRMARSGTAGESGMDVAGYRDYRGVPVVGAWLWDDAWGIGIATEIDASEAFETVNANLAIIALATILVAGLLVGLALIFIVSRARVAASEGYLSAIVENLVDGIIVIDERGIIKSLNVAAEEMFGYSPAELVGHNVKMLVPDRLRSEHDTALQDYVRTGEAKIIGIGREVVGQRKDGTEFPMDIALGEAWTGKQRMFVGLVRDISERKKAEQEIADKERLRAILDDSPIGVAITTASDSALVFRNSRINEIMQYPDDPSEAPNARDFYVDADEHRTVGDILAQEGRILDREVRARRADGSEFVSLLSVVPFEYEGQAAWLSWVYDISRLKDAEAERDQQSKLLSQVLNTVDQGVVKYNRDRTLALWNARSQEILDFPEEMLRVGQPVEERIRFMAERGDYGAGDLETLVEQRNKTMWSGQASRREATLASGGTYHVAMLPTDDGGLVISYTDITDRKRAEDELHASQALLDGVIENAGMPIYVKDTAGRYQLVNSAWEAYSGLLRAEAVGKTDYDIFPESVAEEYWRNDHAVMVNSELSEMEEVGVKDGNSFTFLSQKFPLHSADGEVSGLCGMSTDITDRKRAEERMRESEERFRAILDGSPIGVGIVRAGDSRFVYGNRRLCEMLQVEEIADTDAAPYYAAPEKRLRVIESARQRGHVENFEIEMRRTDGVALWVLLSITPIETYEGDEARLSWYYDITERKRVAERVEQQSQLLNQVLYTVVQGLSSLTATVTSLSGINSTRTVSHFLMSLCRWGGPSRR